MHTLEITIQRKTDRDWPVVVEQSVAGSFLTLRSEGLLELTDDVFEFFFGREQVVEELHQKLKQHPFLSVLGASGSGKSSVVLAGLVPFL